jgi:hypothetical protein
MKKHFNALPLVTALASLTLAIPAVSNAEILIGCRHKTTGAVRIVDDAAMCHRSEAAFTFNVEGVAGPAGPPGPPGSPGPAGQQGPAGATGPGVTTIAGIVQRAGVPSPMTLYGFTVIRTEVGKYEVTFPVGSFATFPAVTVSATAGPDASLPFAVARVERVIWSPVNGFAVATIGVSATTPEKAPVDNGFHFIAAASLPPPSP